MRLLLRTLFLLIFGVFLLLFILRRFRRSAGRTARVLEFVVELVLYMLAVIIREKQGVYFEKREIVPDMVTKAWMPGVQFQMRGKRRALMEGGRGEDGK
jgi:hypothetical protein